MTTNGGTTKQPLLKPCFSTSKLTLYITVVRLLFIFEVSPEEILSLLRLSSVQSTVVRYRDTLGYLQTASAFRHLFPSTSQAYMASSSPPPVLVWILFVELEKWWLPESLGAVLWRLGLLLVDYMIAALLERIAVSSLVSKTKITEQELQKHMPEAIQPPRAHLFDEYVSTSKKQGDTPPLVTTRQIPLLAALLYYASPVSIVASGLFDSFQNVASLLILWSLYEMCFPPDGKQTNVSLAAVSLAIATYLQPWSMVFTIPICISSNKSASVFMILFLLAVVWLQVLVFLLVGSKAYWMWKPIQATTPNLGPLWYFQMQLFDRFHDYFYILFAGLPYLVVLPLTSRLYQYPIVLITCLWFVGTLFHYNPTLLDFNICLCLLIMSPRSMARMNVVSIIATCSIPVTILLYILDYDLWLEFGSGNANYVYFQCLAYNAFVGMIFLDFVSASLQRDKALRMTTKIKKQEEGEGLANDGNLATTSPNEGT